MISASADIDGFKINTAVNGLAIYLDNFAIIQLAKGEASRRRRFITALRSGHADLIFSVSNVAELSGPLGDSLESVRTFLHEIGPHWFPVEMDAFEVVKREQSGVVSYDSCVSKQFLTDYFQILVGDRVHSSKVISLTEEFFNLAAVLNWVGSQRGSIRKSMPDLDAALFNKIAKYCTSHAQDPQWIDRTFPVFRFDPSKPATSVYVNLIRCLILESKAYKLVKNDGVDFCHTVLGSAFANFAALDKHWKRRVANLPKPNGFAAVYYAMELDEMVSDIESALQSLTNDQGLAAT
jgi:hypothetical protein